MNKISFHSLFRFLISFAFFAFNREFSYDISCKMRGTHKAAIA